MNLNRVVFVFVALTLITCESHAYSLQQAYELAKANDRQWKQAQARMRETQELLPMAQGQLKPQVALGSSLSQIYQQQAAEGQPASSQSYLSYSASLSLRQSLYRPRLFRGVEQARAQVDQALHQLRHEEQQLAVRVTTTYVDCLFAIDRRRMLDAQKALVAARLAAARAGLRAGQGTRNDVDDASAEFDRVSAQTIQAEQAVQLSRRQLELLTGQPPIELNPLIVSSFEDGRLAFSNIEDSLSIALRQNPQILAAREEVRISVSVLSQADAGRLPTVDLLMQIGNSKAENGFFASTSTRSGSLGVQLSLPLTSGGVIDAQTRQMAARLEQSRESLEQISNKIRLDVQSTHDSLSQGKVFIGALGVSVRSAEEAVKSSQKGQIAGVRTLLDILRAESNLYQAQVELANARYSYIVAWIKLQAMMGAVNSQTMQQLESIFHKS
jgi:outer membrane protein/protease secretion system outer membrane protein